MKHLLFNLFLATFITTGLMAQSPEINVIDTSGNGDYTTVSEAIEYVNGLETLPEGGIEFQLTDGQTFTDSLPVITASATVSAPLIFTRTGGGEKPLVAHETSGEYYGLRIADMGYVSVDGLKFNDPTIGNDSVAYLYGGIHIQNSYYIDIHNCEFSNFAKHGIYIESASNNITIEDNILTHSDSFESTELSIYGIYANHHPDADSLLIDANRLYNIRSVNSSAYGIRVKGVSGQISNNMISLYSPEKVYGLRFDGYTGKIIDAHFNSVYLYGDAAQKGYAVDFQGAAGEINFSDNIMINNRSMAADSSQLAVMIGYNGPDHNFDHNIYYVENAESYFKGEYYDTLCNTISQWQDVSATDEGARVFSVAFTDIATGDLHLDTSMALMPEMAGEEVTAVGYDFDDQNRGALPYIGADEDAVNPFPYFDIALLPDNINYGAVQLGGDSIQSIEVANQLNDADNLHTITATDGFTVSEDGVVFYDTLHDVTLLASDTLELYVKFQPAEIQDYTEQFIVNAGVQTFSAALSGEGISPDLVLSDNQIEFGEVPIHTDSTRFIYMANTSGGALDVSFTLPEDYTFQATGGTEWFSSVSETLAADDTLQGQIRWEPKSYNFYDDTVTIESATLDLTLTLHGRCIGVDFQVETSLTGLWHTASDWGDFDNDGDMDLLLSGYGLEPGKGETYVYENQGDFQFEAIDQEFTGLGNPGASWVDYDNDGDLDIFITGQDTLNVYKCFFYTNENGSFTEWECADILPLTSASVDWADFNRDGYPDLLMTGTLRTEDKGVEPHTKIYINNGDGTFTDHEHNLPNVSNGDAKWADFDKDTDLDLAIMGSTEASFEFITEIYRNVNGNYERINIDLTGMRYGQVHWGDYDNDDDLDLYCNGSYSNEEGSISYIVKNEGYGSFTLTDLMQYGARQGDSDWVDMDNDGDLDIIFNGIYNNALWLGRYYVYNDQQEYQLVDTLVEIKYADLNFADVNNDNKLDLFLGGRYDFQDYRAYIYKNWFHTLNTAPEAPANLEALVDTCTATFTWEEASDPDGSSVTYNLRIGSEPGLGDVFNGHVSWDGNRLISKKGNMDINDFMVIPCLPQGTYYAAIQAIDHNYAVSEWSNEVDFEITYEGIETLDEHALKIYPNPAKEKIQIDLTTGTRSEYLFEICNMRGKVIYNQMQQLHPGSNHISINLPATIAPGNYVLRVKNIGNAGRIVKMLTIEK